MAKPLHTEETRPRSVQFSHFGVLDDGKRSKGAAVTSIVVNGLILAIILILGAIVKTSPKLAKQLTELTLPPEQPPAPKPPVRPPPPPPKPLPTPPKLESRVPTPEPVPELKPLPTPVMPKPALTPAPPKAVTPPPAPVHVNLANPAAAAMAHNDPAPTAVRLGSATNPINNTSGPAVSNVNLGRSGAPGMNAGNTGLGANATKINLGSGSPNSQAMNGTGRGGTQITGVKLGGVTGGTYGSKGSGTVTQPVQIGNSSIPAAGSKPQVQSLQVASPPKVIYKPTPVYSAEAKSMHLEGNVSVKIRVDTSGAVTVLGIVHSLGHGLDESAMNAARATRFRPAVDNSGKPVDWEGVVSVNFQIS
jgi:TonB family protein